MDEREIGERVKGGIIGGIKGTGQATPATITTIAEVVRTTVKETSDTGGVIGDAATGAVKGAIGAAGDVSGVAIDTTEHTMSKTATAASKVGASVGNAAKAAVDRKSVV